MAFLSGKRFVKWVSRLLENNIMPSLVSYMTHNANFVYNNCVELYLSDGYFFHQKALFLFRRLAAQKLNHEICNKIQDNIS